MYHDLGTDWRVQRDPACSAVHRRQREASEMKNIFVGNLSLTSTEDMLRSLFENYGPVERVNIVTHRESGRPRGFGFVAMTNDVEAVKAINALNGTALEGRTLSINEARQKTDRPKG